MKLPDVQLLAVTARPVHWGADHGLWLYPEPHLVVCADSAAQVCSGCPAAPPPAAAWPHSQLASGIPRVCRGCTLVEFFSPQYAVPPFEDDGCSVLNPGSFYVDFGFSAFTPLTGEVEPCKVP
jgi:hypothetical protein